MITYIRSSLLGSYDICEQKGFLVYGLGFKDKENVSALKGTITHRALQCLGDKKIAQKEGRRKVDFEGRKLSLKECDDLRFISQLSFDYYTSQSSLKLTEDDLEDCIRWVNIVVTANDGMLDPRNQNIHITEQFFDIEIQQDWAKYDFILNGERIVGNLKIRGTIDLIIDEGNNYFHILDFKTGRRINWATFKEKTYEDLEYDTQLLLYYYAMKQLYPEKEFIVSIYYINAGGLFSYPYEQKHYNRAEDMLKQKFSYIRSIEIPRLVSGDNTAKICKSMCAFSKLHPSGNGNTICQHIHNEIKTKGITKVVEEYADFNSLGKYTGGGRIDQ